MASEAVIKAIDESLLNRGLSGVDWAADPANIAIEAGDDIALFDGEGDGNYQVHFLFQSRGFAAIKRAREAFDAMFREHGAELIFGLVPGFLRHAKMMARYAGGKFAGVRDTSDGPCELYVLSKEMWKGDEK